MKKARHLTEEQNLTWSPPTVNNDDLKEIIFTTDIPASRQGTDVKTLIDFGYLFPKKIIEEYEDKRWFQSEVVKERPFM